VVIEKLPDLSGVRTTFYVDLKANIKEVLEDDIPNTEKAKKLATLAIKSITANNLKEECDGIIYLNDAVSHGIRTPLTELYKCELIREAKDAMDLVEAREWFAKQSGIK